MKVPELAAEVDVGDVEMETDSVPTDAVSVRSDDSVDSGSDDDDEADEDSDENDVVVHSVGSSDTDDVHELSDGNSDTNDNDDGGSPPSPPAADAVEQTAVVAADDNSTAVPPETSRETVPENMQPTSALVTQHVLPAPDLDNSLSCFKTAKRKKPVSISPPVSKDDDTDDSEVSI